MPLFHHKDKHDTNAPMSSAGTGTGAGTGIMAPSAHRPYDSTNLNTTNTIPGSGTHHHDGPGLTGQSHHLGPQTGYNNNTYPQQAQYANDGYGAGHGVGPGPGPGVGATGVGAGAGTGTGQHGYVHGTSVGGPGMGAGAGELPSANVINRSAQNHSSGGGSALTGKIESAVGTVFGSESLKMKGAQKQNEANAYKLQASELEEAERLEKEASMRRERAVAHGAHPDNKHLGAHPGAGSGF